MLNSDFDFVINTAYKIEAIEKNDVYTSKVEKHLFDLYDVVALKNYLKKMWIWKVLLLI